MLSATTRVIVYDSSSLQSELLATGLESLALGFEIKCANNLESLVDLLSMDQNCVVVISDTSMNGSAISLAKHLRARFHGLPLVFLLQAGRGDRVIEEPEESFTAMRACLSWQTASLMFTKGKSGYEELTWD